ASQRYGPSAPAAAAQAAVTASVLLESKWQGAPPKGQPQPGASAAGPGDGGDGGEYVQVASKQLVGIYLSVWVRRSLLSAVHGVQVTTIATGFGGYLGNKGAVAARMRLFDSSLVFVASHLTAGEAEGDEARRNADVHDILRRAAFVSSPDGGGLVPMTAPAAALVSASLGPGHWPPGPAAITDHDLVIWLGDLNYRLCTAPAPAPASSSTAAAAAGSGGGGDDAAAGADTTAADGADLPKEVRALIAALMPPRHAGASGAGPAAEPLRLPGILANSCAAVLSSRAGAGGEGAAEGGGGAAAAGAQPSGRGAQWALLERLQRLRLHLDAGGGVPASIPPHEAAALLLLWCGQLPCALIPQAAADAAAAAAPASAEDAAALLRRHCNAAQLPVLRALLRLLRSALDPGAAAHSGLTAACLAAAVGAWWLPPLAPGAAADAAANRAAFLELLVQPAAAGVAGL
ncbi:Type I inositol 1,4,5-trisphosphate 5-phosphatase 2, partial [Tetrabaena socialis]